MQSILSRLYTLITDKLAIATEDIHPEKSFIKDYGIDSLDLFEFMTEVEKTFAIHIPDEAAEKIVTTGQLIYYLNEHAPESRDES